MHYHGEHKLGNVPLENKDNGGSYSCKIYTYANNMIVWMTIEIEGKSYKVNVAHCLVALKAMSSFP